MSYDPALLAAPWNTLASGGTQSPYLLLPYHLDRLIEAANCHGWSSTRLSFDDLKRACDNAVLNATAALNSIDGAGAMKLRILLAPSGALTVAASPASPLSFPDPVSASLMTSSLASQSLPDNIPSASELLIIHLDTEPTPSTVFTRTKTTYRPQYSAARARWNIPPLPAPSNVDALLFNTTGELTETSIRNIAFRRRSPPCWVTPRAETGCLPGTMRRLLLELGNVVEARDGELSKESVRNGEYVLTFNGVEGCRLGRVALGSS
ncbi:Aminodeoxychorismate lyase [Grifola frondosa]|uniref:Aminodeoxychorismate lyase n=1 Tax=Grifola frondosa TaxID=5627 RepID=A0A1C7MSY1_GRIFR|nr:Aminodeoxychorismate lyase [Grifola frondosa]